MKQTVVEWLLEQIDDIYIHHTYSKEFKQAKEMKKQQVIDARLDGCISYSGTEVALISDVVDTEQYYNEQFKNK